MPVVGKKSFTYLNKSLPRVDGFNKVTGRALYAADLQFAGMLCGGMLRSPYAHAQVKAIDVTKARSLPGVYAVLTYRDLQKTKSWAGYRYVTDRVRYVGDVVAIVAADSKEALEDALEAIEVSYEELPGVFNIEEAMAEGASLVHEDLGTNVFNASHFKIRKGDVETAFAQCDVVINREYRTNYVEHAYIEPEAVVAVPNPTDGVMTVYSSSQNPYLTRRWVADVLNVSMNQVRVVQQTLGGGFGGKEEGVGLIAARAALLANLTKRPVKIVNTREDSILESTKRHPIRFRYKAGATKDGHILALEGELAENCGAYSLHQYMNFRASVHAAGVYEIPNVKVDVFGVFTNNVTSGAMRGYSSPQIIFAQEQLMEELAEELGMDPIEFKLKNILKTGSLTATSQKLEQPVILDEIVETLLAKTDFTHKKKAYKQEQNQLKKGIGMAICYRGCGLGAELTDASGAVITATDDGTVMINSGLIENGQGLKTAFSQIVAETMGIPTSLIHFIGVDTHTIADGGMTVASRTTVMGSQALKIAATKLKELLLGTAAMMLKTSVENVELQEGFFYQLDNREIAIPFAQVCTVHYWTGQQSSVFHWFRPKDLDFDFATGQGKAFPTYSYSCVVAEVEVDMETGYVEVQKVTSGHDVGTAINPKLIEGQVYGGIAMGAGFAVLEEVNITKGKVSSQNLDTYLIPTILDMPEMEAVIFECEDGEGTYGAKSLGEPATEAVAAAIANAIYHATGRRARELPADLERTLLCKKLQPGGGSHA